MHMPLALFHSRPAPCTRALLASAVLLRATASVRLAEQHVRADISREVGRLIRLTKTHDVQPGDRLGAILISIDLSILGAEPARYDAYAAAIRQEFIHVGEADYRAGRGRVLRHFAARPVIFPDAGFAATHDGRARDNLARELASLG